MTGHFESLRKGEFSGRSGLWQHARAFLVLLLCELLVFLPAVPEAARAGAVLRSQANSAGIAGTLHSYLYDSYLELFQLAPKLHFSAAEVAAETDALRRGEKGCVNAFKERSDQYSKQISATQAELKRTSARVDDTGRHNFHCRIQNLRSLKSQTELLAHQGIPVAYANMSAKLDLIQHWPADYQQIQQEIVDGSYPNRRWGDVKDIGFRQIAPGQADDIKSGQEAVKQMKQYGLLPKAIVNQAITDYVNSVAQRVAAHSDLQIPLHVTVLDSKEVNAFALPGGYMFVERGLLEATDDEAELAGVLAHEIAHVTARHAHKLMERATIAGIFYQAAEVAALVLTGGVAGIGMYYALQYGFYGLGLVLDLKLLGVSREYELQADQLGIQYTWNAGYDPAGFIRFFDKMATKEGYVNGLSWFRTHPPFYERMLDAEREIQFLPKKKNLVVQTSAFEKMKKELAPLTAQANEKGKNKPSLFLPEKGCTQPKKLEYTGGEQVETLCSRGTTQSMSASAQSR